MKPPAQRMSSLPENYFAGLESRISKLLKEGKDIIRLDIGSPDLPPPAPVIEALQKSAQDSSHHGYQTHSGPYSLRQSWVEMYKNYFDVELDPATQLVPLLGTKEGIFHLTQAWVDPGDIVLVPDPGYMTYSRAVLFAGGEPYYMPLLRENGYLPDLKAIPRNVLQRTKLMWLNYPNNPTAAAADLDFFVDAVALAKEYEFLLCHDAAYNLVTFDGCRAPSILEVPGAENTAVEFSSLSKSHNMAGWRVGVAAGNSQAVRSLYHLKTNIDSSHFLPILEAAAVALRGSPDWISERNSIYCQRRDLAVRALQAMGLDVDLPRGSLYLWCPVPSGWTSIDFVTFLLENYHVSLTPGTVFGSRGEGYFRISIAAPRERIEEATVRMAAALTDLTRRDTE